MMNNKLKIGLIAGGGLVLGTIIGSTGAGNAAPTTSAPQVTVTQTVPGPPGGTVTVPAPTVTITAPAVTITAPAVTITAPAVSPEDGPAGSTCDAAREAILTGSKTDIEKAFRALQADKSADSTAREYARYYLGRDAGNKELREMDITLIQTACSL